MYRTCTCWGAHSPVPDTETVCSAHRAQCHHTMVWCLLPANQEAALTLHHKTGDCYCWKASCSRTPLTNADRLRANLVASSFRGNIPKCFGTSLKNILFYFIYEWDWTFILISFPNFLLPHLPEKSSFKVSVPIGFFKLLNPILHFLHHMLCFLNLFSLLH